MSIQQAAKAVVKKSGKTRTITGLLTVVSIVLTGFSMIPYELGKASTVIHPDAKGYLVVIGIIPTAFLQAIRPYLPSPNAPPSEPPQTP